MRGSAADPANSPTAGVRVNPIHFEHVVRGVIHELENTVPKIPELPTGFVDLDRLTRGVPPGHLWAVVGRSGVGKSVWALDVARSVAVAAKRAVLLVTRAEHARGVMQRLLSAEARVPLQHLQAGALTDADWTRLSRYVDDGLDAPFLLCELPRLDLDAIDALLRAHEAPVRMLVVDDIARGPTQLHSMTALRDLARATDTAVVAVLQPDPDDGDSQLRRAEEVADLVLKIYREDQTDHESARAGEADLIVTRHRHGPTAWVPVAFQGHYSRFVGLI
jgi:replicative DNA helicase